MKGSLKLSSAMIALSMLGAGSGTALAQTAPAADEDRISVDDIVVTATRREESANKIPVAIKAMGGEQLGQLNVTNFEKLVEYLPNVRTASRGPGVSSIYIRGLSTDTAGSQILGVAGVQPNVALYVNDAPASTPGRNLDIHATDLSRVETLAGPQGTLFGANAMGGAIRYITNKPNLGEFDAGFTAHASSTRHGAASFGVDGFVNVPIIKDTLGIRLAFYSDHQGGYIDNVAGTYQMPWNPGGPGVLPTGNPLLVAQAIESCVGVVNCVATPTGTSAGWRAPLRRSISNTAFIQDDYNDANYNGGRGTVTWQLNEDWSVEAMGLYQELETDGVFDYSPAVGDLKVQQYGPNTLKDTITLGTLTLKGRLGMLDLIYTSSYQDHHSVQQSDYARYANIGLYMPYYNCDRGVYYAGYGTSAAQGQTCYAPNNSYKVNDRNRRWTQELRLTTPADKPLRATLGLFYDVNRIYDVTQWNYVLRDAGFIYDLAPHPSVNVLNVGPLPGAGFVNTILRRDRQFAIYGEASYDVIPDKLTITGGARYYSESAGMYGGSSTSFTSLVRANCATVSVDPGSGLTTCNYIPLVTPPSTLNASAVLSNNLAGINPAKYSGVIFKGNVTYKFNPDSLVYFTFSEGFRPGGFNRKGCNGGVAANPTYTAACSTNRAYEPDKVKNFEIGAKLGLFDRKLQINLAAYKIDWKEIQIAAFNQNISNQTFVSNLANGKIQGIEGDITARPSRGLTLSAGFSYNDSELTGCTNNAIAQLLCSQGVVVPVGSPLALSPKFQGNMRIRYEWENENGLKPFVQVGFHHVGSSISSVVDNTNILYTGCNSPYAVCGQTSVINGVTVNPGDPIQLQQQSFTQAGYNTFEASIGVSKDNWSVTVYAENIGDERPELFISANDGEKRITTMRPRTIGMRVSYKM
ncbi:TonB-dependent receptor [Novosphingobium sp.]|uniref:TonB-dependent receptor n=1 Tax=Novosphingobium sp. TaxID=1874826 RepID=UPI0025E82398|nr:TonB-dependent receptor [Novosphingobium sp.]MCC6924225.1 TonB-dependent receptor [Novosphingobium sp.]